VLKGIFGFPARTRSSGAHQRVYAVGDVHGRLDLLDEILSRIESDNARRRAAETTIVFLGDLIDRGPQSAQVVERLMRYRPQSLNTIFLMGNHEEVLLRIADGDAAIGQDWLRFGGADCVRSYGIDPADLRSRNPADVPRILRERIPAEHLKFLSGFNDSASFEKYLFVHAGIRPGITLSRQRSEDLRWIRSPFLEFEFEHEWIVVHGHTMTDTLDIRPNRIGIDTGAWRTGVLTALGLEGDERWPIQTGVGVCLTPSDV
jgi:serine/threonine protein phosphatase 1